MFGFTSIWKESVENQGYITFENGQSDGCGVYFK